MRCNLCNCQAPTCYVEFRQNIGAFVMRFSKSIKGNLCRQCINKKFAEFTLITIAVGWCGMISLILAPIFVINNLVYFAKTFGMMSNAQAGPRLAAAPSEDHPTLSLTPEITAKLERFRHEIEIRLNSGENRDQIAFDIALRVGVSAHQVELYANKFIAK